MDQCSLCGRRTSPSPPIGEIVPVVEEEPLAVSEHEEEDESSTENRDEPENREPGAGIVGEVGMAV